MFRTSLILAITALSTLTQPLHAYDDDYMSESCYQNNCPPSELYCGGLWLGINYATYTFDDFQPMIGWYTECFLIDFGADYERHANHPSFGRFSVIETMGHIGLRRRLIGSNVFLTGGGVGSSASFNFKDDLPVDDNTSYRVGAFVGLDFQPSCHFLISAKINPFMFINNVTLTKQRIYDYFSDGDFTFSFVF